MRFIDLFIKNKIWEKSNYRNEYIENFEKEDLDKIKSLKIHLHNHNYPFSNLHSYEKLIENYIGENNLDREKIISSGIGEASKIAVIEVLYESENKLIKNLTYEEEKDYDLVIDNLIEPNLITWDEQNRIKSIVCEFIQFFVFNLHLNFLTKNYDFNFSKVPNPIGLSIISENDKFYFESDKIELLSHYILWEENQDRLVEIMQETSNFWYKYISSIHFFLDALKGNFMTSTNFTKLVFTFESFFSEKSSNDFMTLVAPLLVSKNIKEMKEYRETLKQCFSLRNKIVHGNSLHNMKENKKMTELFFKLKNLITNIFLFMIHNNLYLEKNVPKLNHELVFRFLPNGLNSIK